MELLIFYLLLAISISFICSVAEAVLLSTPSSYIKMKEGEGDSRANRFLTFKKDIDKPLSAILSLNTIAHTIGAAGVGAQAGKVFGEEYFAIISAVLTVLILVLSEIIPKTIGASYWKQIGFTFVPIIRFMIIICYPLVWLSKFITRLIAKENEESSVSREEVSAMVNVGVEEGIFHSRENKIIQNLIKLETIRARDIMTPRIVVAVASEEMTLNEFFEDKSLLHYSRIPVYNENKDNITGYVLRQNVFEMIAGGSGSKKLADIKRDIRISIESRAISALWEDLLSNKEHISLILDEYGSFEGVVTMEDIIETIFGLEILDEKDNITDMQEYARERWAKRQKEFKDMTNLQ